MPQPLDPVLEFRVAFTASDVERAVRFWCDGLGLEPVDTPWGDRNARLADPDGMQITLFASKDSPQAAPVDSDRM